MRPAFDGFARQRASSRSAAIVPTFPTAQTATPSQASAEIPSSPSRQMNANGSEKSTTNSAWSWKNQKKFRLAFAPHAERSVR